MSTLKHIYDFSYNDKYFQVSDLSYSKYNNIEYNINDTSFTQILKDLSYISNNSDNSFVRLTKGSNLINGINYDLSALVFSYSIYDNCANNIEFFDTSTNSKYFDFSRTINIVEISSNLDINFPNINNKYNENANNLKYLSDNSFIIYSSNNIIDFSYQAFNYNKVSLSYDFLQELSTFYLIFNK